VQTPSWLPVPTAAVVSSTVIVFWCCSALDLGAADGAELIKRRRVWCCGPAMCRDQRGVARAVLRLAATLRNRALPTVVDRRPEGNGG
jgi:hypothetical protein